MPRIVDIPKNENDLLKIMSIERGKPQVIGLGSPMGFVARIFADKSRAARCYLNYRLTPNGSVKWLPVGAFPDEPLDQIRQRAMEARAIFEAGGDPTGCRSTHITCSSPMSPEDRKMEEAL